MACNKLALKTQHRSSCTTN